ncbi:MAG: DUF2520 domain-containing protein [Gammaproteobacteria bacterium]|nr:DUF2520 domain-containing protein [Gammaproteobacteria bacterium]
MRQVPSYAIIGNGRMAKHIRYYLSQLGLAHLQWHRPQSTQSLHKIIEQSSHILLLITDRNIDRFFIEHLTDYQHNKVFVHFSGALMSSYISSAHPLQTFSTQTYPLSTYQSIPFIIEQQGPSFQQLLPGFPNQHYAIPRNKKPYYHALCVLANNFTTLIWQKFFTSMQEHFSLPQKDLQPYLQQTLHNLTHDYSHALTGPFARHDHLTLEKNLQALQQDNYQKIFKAFIDTYLTEKNL